MSENLWELLQPAFAEFAANPAWICRVSSGDGRRVVTYRQLQDAAVTLAADLRKRGISADSSVAIIAPNGPEFAAAALAAWKIGAAIAPVHIGNSAQDTAAQITALAPDILLCHEYEHVHEHDAAIPITLSADADAITAESALPASHDAMHLAARIYTSGSTGTPKVVRLSHGNFASNIRAVRRLQTFTADDRFISLLPLSHAMGLLGNLLLPLCSGAAIVTPKVLAAAEILETLQAEKVSVVIAVPRLFRNVMLGLEKKFRDGGALKRFAMAAYLAILKCAPIPIRRHINAPIRKKLGGKITAWVSGGSHLDGRISRYYHALGLPLRQGYGLTETAPLVCVQDEFDAAVDSVGKPVAEVQVKIHAPDCDGCGEVCIRGANVMLGYEDAAQTAEAMHDGWFQSGDIGRVDDAGRLFLTGRSKRLIVTEAGKNIYPEELETRLERDPAVKEAGVLEAAARPVCVLAMQVGSGDDAVVIARETLAKFNRDASSHNRISRFALVDELPRTPLGKMALSALPDIFARHEVKH